MIMQEKVKALYMKIVDATEELGLTIIVDKMWVIDLKTGQTTSMQITQTGERDAQSR